MASTNDAILDTLKVTNLIPEIFANAPSSLQELTISYPTCTVALGNELTPELTSEQPGIVFPGAKDGATYTLAMLDPDAPTRAEPTYRSFRHWVVTGLKKAEPTTGKLKLTHNATTPYRPPGPRPNSGLHRYTFVLFEEPQSAQPFHIPGGAKEYGAELEERRSWDVMEFAARYGLTLVGVNFFHVRAE